MPTKKIVNNLPILNKTVIHWGKAETALGEAITLPDGTTHDGAIDLATNIKDIEKQVVDDRVLLAKAQGVRNNTRNAVHTAAKQARKSLRGLAKNVPDVLGLANLPALTSAPAVLLEIYENIASVWEMVNGLPQASVPAAKLPLRLPLTENSALVQLTLAQFQERTEALRAAAESLAGAEATVRASLGTRNDLHDQAEAIVKDYGAAVRGLLPDGHPLLDTIPTLSG
jgi:hypothetical protein